jgi:hypothetical protein
MDATFNVPSLKDKELSLESLSKESKHNKHEATLFGLLLTYRCNPSFLLRDETKNKLRTHNGRTHLALLFVVQLLQFTLIYDLFLIARFM